MMQFHNKIIREYEDTQLPKIKAGNSLKIDFDTEGVLENPLDSYKCKLRLVGDVDVQPNWMWEGGYPYLYRLIDDALSTETKHSQFSLKMNLHHEDWPRRAYYQVLCPPRLSIQYPVTDCDGKWDLLILAKAENLCIDNGGRVSLVIEKYRKKDGVDRRELQYGPDEVTVLDFPEGTYDFTEFHTSVTIDDDTACLLVFLACEHAGGTVWFEDPRLINQWAENILPQFTVSNPFNESLNWMGENLSRKDWSNMEVSLNGKPFFTGELFQRCHRYSENEISIPAGLLQKGKNTLEIKNIDDYFSPIPYKLKKLELLYAATHSVDVVSCPSIVYADSRFGVLIHTASKQTTVTVQTSSAEIHPEKNNYTFEDEGLHVIPFFTSSTVKESDMGASHAGTDLSLRFTADGWSETAVVERIVYKTDDNVLTGTGDAIYVPQEVTQTEEFLAWYLQNEIGNFITFRPTYRWCGTRALQPQVWERIVELCQQYGMYYCHIIDGRELPGANANPTKAMLESEYFIGNQGHERDGAFYYWGPKRADNENEILFLSLQDRVVNHPDWRYYNSAVYTKDGHAFGHYNPIDTNDMKEAAEHFIQNCKTSLHGVKRHTGPSVLFKYLFEAGVEVGGAELMYGPHEAVLSALRGASLAYHRKEFAAHLAVQWSTTPHDTPARYRRYQLALFVCYLQGTHHINTEEGLWRIEERFCYFDRFSDACMEHRKIQTEFTHFVKAHSRRGTMVNPTALLYGQYDAWLCFGRPNAWGHLGDAWKFDTPEESWDLLNIFYPDNVLDAIYRHPCENKPQGFYTRTPYGTVDIVPIEAESQLLDSYQSAAFLGWNTAEPAQIDKLAEYVQNGGTLLLGWPHLFTDTDRTTAIYGDATPVDKASIHKLLGVDFHGFVSAQTPDGTETVLGDITPVEQVVVRSTLNGHPLVLEHSIGQGKVLFVNLREYPAAKTARPIYESLLRELGELGVASQKERGWITTTDTVDTGVFDRENGLRDIYAININWWDEQDVPAQATLHFAGNDTAVSISRGVIHIFTLGKEFGVWTADNDTDVISITETGTDISVTLQGYGKTSLCFITAQEISSDAVPLTKLENGIYSSEIDLYGLQTIRFQK